MTTWRSGARLLTNHGNDTRQLTLRVTYLEVILNQQAVDQRHLAFNKLFIESEFPGYSGLSIVPSLAAPGREKLVYLAHFYHSKLCAGWCIGSYETHRRSFSAAADDLAAALAESVARSDGLSANWRYAAGLLVCALQVEATLLAYHTVQLAFYCHWLPVYAGSPAVDLSLPSTGLR